MNDPTSWRRAIAASVLAIVASYSGLHAQCPDGSAPPCRRAVAAPPANSVAVLYFERLSPDTSDQYVADGLTEQVIELLGRVPHLAVVSRSAVRRYRGGTTDPPAAARSLAASYLVTGTIRRAGARLRVSAELARAGDGRRLWGDLYERTDSDLFAIEEDIAQSVARGVVGRLLPQEVGLLADRPTRDHRAYDHYLRGNYALAHRTPDGVAVAIAEYEAAASLDTTFTQALVWLAFAYGLFIDRAWTYPGLSRGQVLERATAFADQALRRDSMNSEAWMVRGEILAYRRPNDLDSAVTAYRRAIQLNPRNAQAIHSYGVMLGLRGDYGGAMDAYRHALRVDPARPVSLLNIARIAFANRSYPEAITLIDSTIALDGGFVDAYLLRVRVLVLLGRFDEARQTLTVASRVGGAAPLMVALVEARSGDTTAARAQVRRFLQDSTHEPPTDVDAAMVLLAVADTTAALDLLEQVHPRSWWLHQQLLAPEFDAIRSDVRFQRLLGESRPR